MSVELRLCHNGDCFSMWDVFSTGIKESIGSVLKLSDRAFTAFLGVEKVEDSRFATKERAGEAVEKQYKLKKGDR